MQSLVMLRVWRKSLVIALLAVLVVFSMAAAQRDIPATDSGVQPVRPELSARGSYNTSYGDPLDGLAPDDNPPPGTKIFSGPSPSAVSTTFSYYMVSGATLRGRNSTTTYTYTSTGCVYVPSGTSGALILNTEMMIPDGSLLKYIRVIFKDTSATGSVSAYMTRYTPGTMATDLVSISSSTSFAGGYGFAVSSAMNETIDNASYAYTLIGWPSTASASLEICGIRAAYYAPLRALMFMPTVNR